MYLNFAKIIVPLCVRWQKEQGHEVKYTNLQKFIYMKWMLQGLVAYPRLSIVLSVRIQMLIFMSYLCYSAYITSLYGYFILLLPRTSFLWNNVAYETQTSYVKASGNGLLKFFWTILVTTTTTAKNDTVSWSYIRTLQICCWQPTCDTRKLHRSMKCSVRQMNLGCTHPESFIP